MDYRVYFLKIDITVEDSLLDHPHNLGWLSETCVSTKDNQLYNHCRNIREVEQTFERHHNFPTNDDAVTWPKQKVKVLKVEPWATR